MPARNRKGLSENTRLRIQTTMIVKRLESHLLGEVEMSSTQIRAAEILLNKTLPNLQSIEAKQEIIHKHANELTDAELLNIAAAGSARDSEEESSQKRLN